MNNKWKYNISLNTVQQQEGVAINDSKCLSHSPALWSVRCNLKNNHIITRLHFWLLGEISQQSCWLQRLSKVNKEEVRSCLAIQTHIQDFQREGRGTAFVVCADGKDLCGRRSTDFFFKILLSIYLQNQQVRLVKMLLSVIQALLVSGLCGWYWHCEITVLTVI